MVPCLNERLLEGSEEECMMMSDLVCLTTSSYWSLAHLLKIQKGISSARSDDTKSLKGVVLDWITPRDQPLRPLLSRSIKTNRGYHHPTTGALLCPAGLDWTNQELNIPFRVCYLMLSHHHRTSAKLASGEIVVRGDQWPLLVYAKQEFNPEEPWDGLFRSELLVWVRMHPSSLFLLTTFPQAFKHIFTSPSSVEKEVKATRSGNARIHGMVHVMRASLAYITTQVCPLFMHIKSTLTINSIWLASLCFVVILGLL